MVSGPTFLQIFPHLISSIPGDEIGCLLVNGEGIWCLFYLRAPRQRTPSAHMNSSYSRRTTFTRKNNKVKLVKRQDKGSRYVHVRENSNLKSLAIEFLVFFPIFDKKNVPILAFFTAIFVKH